MIIKLKENGREVILKEIPKTFIDLVNQIKSNYSFDKNSKIFYEDDEDDENIINSNDTYESALKYAECQELQEFILFLEIPYSILGSLPKIMELNSKNSNEDNIILPKTIELDKKIDNVVLGIKNHFNRKIQMDESIEIGQEKSFNLLGEELKEKNTNFENYYNLNFSDIDCFKCNGTGKKNNGNKCKKCYATGKLENTKKLQIIEYFIDKRLSNIFEEVLFFLFYI